MRNDLLIILTAALALAPFTSADAATQTAQMNPGIELQITPEAGPPYFDVDQEVDVGSYPLFPQGMKLQLTAAKYDPASSQLITPSPTQTYVPGIGMTTVPAPAKPLAENAVMSTVTRCGDTVNFVVEAKQGKNIFYVVTKTTQFVKIWC